MRDVFVLSCLFLESLVYELFAMSRDEMKTVTFFFFFFLCFFFFHSIFLLSL